jgi:hypothetical protein
MPKLHRLFYPTELIDRQVIRLQRDLRNTYSLYRRGQLSQLQALLLGDTKITASFNQTLADIKKFLQKHNLSFSSKNKKINA